MDAIVVLVIGILIVIIGLPIWLAIKMSSVTRRIETLEARLTEFKIEILRWKREREFAEQQKVSEQPKPQPAETFAATETPPPVSPPLVAPIEPPPPIPEPATDFAQIHSKISEESAPTAPPIIPPLSQPESIPTPSFPKIPTINWEQFMGVKLFAWVGGLALFIGVALFLKYSFEHNLIPPEVRVAIGFLTGIGLLIGGVMLSRKDYLVLSQTLCATGVVILYAVTFSCRSIYHFAFFGTIPTFLLMVLITTTAFLLAARMNALVVAILGMLGGFLTPVLLSTGEDNPLGLFGYIALLDAGLIAVALNRRWNFLALLGAAGTVVMQLGWANKFFAVEKLFIAQEIFLGFCALFLLAFFFAKKRDQHDQWFAASAIALPFVSFGFAFYLLSISALGGRPGAIFTFALAADLCLVALVLLDEKLFAAHLAGGFVAFGLLAMWTVGHLNAELLNWGLGFYLVFAILHSVFPIVLQRLRPGVALAWWAQLFPPLALVLIMVPILKISQISFLVWPCVLLVDVLAIGLAGMTTSLLSIVAVLILTIVATGIWIFEIPAEVTGVSSSLFVIGGFAIFFFVIGIFAARKILGKVSQTGSTQRMGFGNFEITPDIAAQLPAMAAILPFLLLIMVTLRLPLENPSAVFGLAALLVVLLLGVARKYKMDWLAAIGLASVLALEHSWHFRHFETANAPVTLAWNLGFFAVFAVFPFIFRKEFSERIIAWGAAALSGPLHFYLVHQLVTKAYPNQFMGLLPAAFALPSLASLIFLLRALPVTNPKRNSQLAWFGGVTLFFITLIFPIQFDRQWITIGWALEGAALLWLFHRVPHAGLRVTGVALLLVAFARLALNPAVLEYHPRSATPILNWYLYAYGIVTVSLLLGAYLIAPPRNLIFGKNFQPVLNSLATVLAFLLLNIEIADYFSEGSTLTFSFSGNFARDMTYTIAWAGFALLLLVLGIAKKLRAARYASLGLLSVTVLKLFFHDLAHLSQLYRIGALISVAIIAMLASFLYQKFLSSNSKSPEAATVHEPPVSKS